ncbi:BLUF domain-containing protein [uncultured Rhodoblastus sp.]|uniref:BLUF domain-containing protein n=1 Tax=uncultured Rhodoblastus sp. TaxID=543037 RepID=UPI0025CC263D|nr:BLUF domain-containing protein [uncultured Rhodoblastus sp.]
MLVRCLYASRPTAACDAPAMDLILQQARKNNPARGLTGLLAISHNLFLQVLEGGRDEVCEIYNAIVRDERHEQVRLLIFEEISERRFGAWTMGQINIDRLNPSLLLKYFKRAELNPFDSSGRATLALLDEMVVTAAISPRGE